MSKESTTINATIDEVWDALVNPQKVKQYMFGNMVISDWKQGSTILCKGEYGGKKYERKGEILRFQPKKLLQYTYFRTLSGLEDQLENYITVTIELFKRTNSIDINLTLVNNTNKQRRELEKNRKMMLKTLKQIVEKNSSQTDKSCSYSSLYSCYQLLDYMIY